MSSTSAPGYSTHTDQLLKRLARIKGQVGGLEGMIESERYCIDVLTQISAVRVALQQVAMGLLEQHITHCVMDAHGSERSEKAQELLAAVGRLTAGR